MSSSSSSSTSGEVDEEDIYETDVDTGRKSKVEAVVKHLRKPPETAERKQARDPRVANHTRSTRELSREVHKLTGKLCSLDLKKITLDSWVLTGKPCSLELKKRTLDSWVGPLRKIENDDVKDDDKASDRKSDDDRAVSNDKETSKEQLLERGAVRGAKHVRRKEPYVTSAKSPPSARDSTNHGGTSRNISAIHNEARTSPGRVHHALCTSQTGVAQMSTQATITPQTDTPQRNMDHFPNILQFPETSRVPSTTSVDHPTHTGTTISLENTFPNTGLPQTIALDIKSVCRNNVSQQSPTVGSEGDALSFATPSMQEFMYDGFSQIGHDWSLFDGLINTDVNQAADANANDLDVDVGGGRGEHATASVDKQHSQVRQVSLPTTGYRILSTVPAVTLPVRSEASTSTCVLEANSSKVSTDCGNIPTVVPPDLEAIFTNCQEIKKKPRKQRDKTDRTKSSLKKSETNALPMNIVPDVVNTGAELAVTCSQNTENCFEDALNFIERDTSAVVTSSLMNPATKGRAGILQGQIQVAPVKPMGVVYSTPATASATPTACNHTTNPDTTIPQTMAQTTMENNWHPTPVGMISNPQVSNTLPVSFTCNTQPVTIVATNQHGCYTNPMQLPDIPAGQAMPTIILPQNGVPFQPVSNMLPTYPVVPLNPQPTTTYQLVGNQLFQVTTIPANVQQLTVGSVPQQPQYMYVPQQQPSSIAAFQQTANMQVLASNSVILPQVPGSTSLPVVLGSPGNISSGFAPSTTPPAGSQGMEPTSASSSQNPGQGHNNSMAASDQIKTYAHILPKRTEA